MKNEARIVAELPPLTEDTHEVCKHMRAASPPASAADLIEQQMPNRRNTRTRRVSDHECSRQLKFSVKCALSFYVGADTHVPIFWYVLGYVRHVRSI